MTNRVLFKANSFTYFEHDATTTKVYLLTPKMSKSTCNLLEFIICL